MREWRSNVGSLSLSSRRPVQCDSPVRHDCLWPLIPHPFAFQGHILFESVFVLCRAVTRSRHSLRQARDRCGTQAKDSLSAQTNVLNACGVIPVPQTGGHSWPTAPYPHRGARPRSSGWPELKKLWRQKQLANNEKQIPAIHAGAHIATSINLKIVFYSANSLRFNFTPNRRLSGIPTERTSVLCGGKQAWHRDRKWAGLVERFELLREITRRRTSLWPIPFTQPGS